jgi:hypothetical protein
MSSLNSDERKLLLDVLRARCADREDLIKAVMADSLSSDTRSDLCEILGNELAERGLDVNSEPTAYGMRIEGVIDSVNRPNLGQSR